MSSPDDARETLKRISAEQGESLAGLSVLIGRNRAYLQQFVERGTPRRLDERSRRRLARYLGVSEELLGADQAETSQHGAVRVPMLSVEASAGPGRMVDGEEALGSLWFDEAWLRRICRGKPADLSTIAVSGDSMAPTLVDGDEILVDRSDAAANLRDGVYVLRRDDTLMVKRIALAPASAMLAIISDNPAYPTWRDVPRGEVDVLARVVWFARTLR